MGERTKEESLRDLKVEIHDLELHERQRIDDKYEVIRVPGGWIYTHKEEFGNSFGIIEPVVSSVFVPHINTEDDVTMLRNHIHVLLEENAKLQSISKFNIPEWDEINQRPASKLPDCPNCCDDELGMINKDNIVCYNCGLSIYLPKRIKKEQE
jgi:hypothetical protein